MSWSEGIVEQFEIVDLDTSEESDFYGPFNSLLAELFPSSEHYQVSPQLKRINGSPDFTFLFIVRRRRILVFFLEVKTFCSLTLRSARESADDQMRQRFRDFASGTISTPILYGVSAFGPQITVYAFELATLTIDPPEIARNFIVVNDIAPEARWAYNLLEPAGEAKLRELVNVGLCERTQRAYIITLPSPFVLLGILTLSSAFFLLYSIVLYVYK